MCREMKRTIPKSLVQRQEKIRQKTLEVVTQAILALESQGYNIKIKDLVSVTGLSRSVFAKPHVRKVLVEHGIIQPQITEGADKANNASPRMAMLLAEKELENEPYGLFNTVTDGGIKSIYDYVKEFCQKKQ